MKKILVYIFTAVIAVVAFFGVYRSPSANVVCADTYDDVITATVLNNSAVTLRHVFNSPSDIFCADDAVYVRTADGCDIYLDEKITSDALNADGIAYLNGLVTLSGGAITLNETTYTGNYSAISAHDETLYALENNVIYKFDYVNGALENKQIYAESALQINRIAAAEDGCAYVTIASDGYTNLIYLNGELFASLDEDVVDLEYNGNVYVLTASGITKYLSMYNYCKYPIISAKSMAISDGIYVLTRTNNVEKVTLDLASSFTLIAASGNADWFYTSPVNGSTRLNKIYVADKSENRIAVVSGETISYLTGFTQPIAVESDNTGIIYVAEYGNKIVTLENGVRKAEYQLPERIIDVKVDYSGNVYALTTKGNVLDLEGNVIKENVTAFDFQGKWYYLCNGFIDDATVEATNFTVDALGNVFAVSGNTLTTVINGVTKKYLVSNAVNISAVTISKVQSKLIGYGDLILFDEGGKCVLVADGSSLGSADISDLYPTPQLSSDAIDKTEGTIAITALTTYMFTKPIEGEIAYITNVNEYVIVCKEIDAPKPFVYCLAEDKLSGKLVGGYLYESSLTTIKYSQPVHSEAKINAANTPIYKFPSLLAPIVARFEKDSMISVLPFAVNYTDDYDEGWFVDAYGNRWYRISYNGKEGYVLAGDTNVNFFSDVEMPQTNATITETATLYRYDEASDSYVEFEAAGLYINKDTRVAVDLPFDTSRKYTKIVFYRDGYGTIDAECYVRTEYISFDGVDLVKIIAIVAIAVAVITLFGVVIYKAKIGKKPIRRDLR